MTRSYGATGTLKPKESRNNLTPELTDRVFEILDDRFVPFAELAQHLNAIPWEVARACRILKVQSRAEEDSPPRSGYYRRAMPVTREEGGVKRTEPADAASAMRVPISSSQVERMASG